MPLREHKVRFGLVGYGAWGRHHAQVIAAHPEAELAGVVTPSEASRAEARARFPGVGVFETAQQMLETLALEVVDVVAPNHVHFPIAAAALKAGCHVLLEKPMATTLADCHALMALAEQAGRQILVGHELRLSSQWGRIKEIIDQGGIGVPWNVLVELSRRPYRLGSDGWRYDPDRWGTGCWRSRCTSLTWRVGTWSNTESQPPSMPLPMPWTTPAPPCTTT